MDATEYMRITDKNERERVRTTAEAGLAKERRASAELLAAEAALLLLEYFAQDGKPPVGMARPAYVDFDFDPEADSVTGAGSDIRKVFNSDDMVIWNRFSIGGFDFDGDVTDFLTGAMEADPSFFLEIGDGVYRYYLPS